MSLIALATELPSYNDYELFNKKRIIDPNMVLTPKAEIHLNSLHRLDQPAD